jgi:hypothetical protein
MGQIGIAILSGQVLGVVVHVLKTVESEGGVAVQDLVEVQDDVLSR